MGINLKYFFGFFYITLVVGQISNYQKQYGASVFSLAGIIDCFVVPLIGAALFTSLASLIIKIVSKFKRKG